MIIFILIIISITMLCLGVERIIPRIQYSSAKQLMEEKQYEQAIEKFSALGNYEDSELLIKECQSGIKTLPLENKYNGALDLKRKGEFKEAIELFRKLGDYKDSKQQVVKCFESDYGKNPENFEIGDSYYLGYFEQDNNANNGKEPVEWIILDKEDSKLVLLSKYTLCTRRYHDTWTEIDWENATLRNWLNDEFVREVFNKEQQDRIIITSVKSNDNTEYGVSGGKDTKDRVFLLSMNEAKRYFNSNKSRRCQATAYAIKNGAYVVSKDNENCVWTLRSPGEYREYIAYVDGKGKINYLGADVDNNAGGVRPAIWIDLSK